MCCHPTPLFFSTTMWSFVSSENGTGINQRQHRSPERFFNATVCTAITGEDANALNQRRYELT